MDNLGASSWPPVQTLGNLAATGIAGCAQASSGPSPPARRFPYLIIWMVLAFVGLLIIARR